MSRTTIPRVVARSTPEHAMRMRALRQWHQRYQADYDDFWVHVPPILATGDAAALASVVHAVATTATLLNAEPIAAVP